MTTFEQWWDTTANTPGPDSYKNWEEACRQAFAAGAASVVITDNSATLKNAIDEIDALRTERDELKFQIDVQAGSIEAVQAANIRLATERYELQSQVYGRNGDVVRLAAERDELNSHLRDAWDWIEDYRLIGRKLASIWEDGTGEQMEDAITALRARIGETK